MILDKIKGGDEKEINREEEDKRKQGMEEGAEGKNSKKKRKDKT